MNETVDRIRVFGERSDSVERIAPGYFHRTFEAEHLARYKWASRWVRNRSVLDVACGTGYGVTVLRAAGAKKVLSVDVSRDALRFGYQRYCLAAACSDAHKLPVATEACEAVVSLETIEHLQDPTTFIRELCRVLPTGGHLLLSTPNAARSSGQNPYHLWEGTLGELRVMLENEGLGLHGVWGQHWGLRPGIWHKIKGLRRILWELERRPTVSRGIRSLLQPIYWCLWAVKS